MSGWRSGVTAAVLLTSLLAASPGANAKAFRGETPLFIPYSEETRSFGDTHLMLRWRVWTLMGEPVVYCQAAWIAPPEKLRALMKAEEAPLEVLARSSLINVYVETSVETREIAGGIWEQQSVWLPCDVGAMTKVFLGTVAEFERLSEREKQPYFSYNAPGSPSWGELFKVGRSYVPAERAKRILKEYDLQLYDVPGWGKAIVKAHLSAFALGMWKSQQRSAKLAEERKRLDAEREERRRRKYGSGGATAETKQPGNAAGGDFWSEPHTAATAEATDFWAAPDNPLTVEEREEDRQLQAKRSELDAEISSLENEQRRQREQVAAKQRELELRTSDQWCDQVGEKMNQCLYSACGSMPSRSLSLLVCDDDDRCCGRCSEYSDPPEGCGSYCYEVEQGRKERARELRAKKEEWQRCADRARPRCGPEGFVDVASCKEEMKSFRETMAEGFAG